MSLFASLSPDLLIEILNKIPPHILYYTTSLTNHTLYHTIYNQMKICDIVSNTLDLFTTTDDLYREWLTELCHLNWDQAELEGLSCFYKFDQIPEGFIQKRVIECLAKAGNLTGMKVAIERRCDLRPEARKYAVLRNRFDCWEYLLQVECPGYPSEGRDVVCYGDLRMFQCYIRKYEISQSEGIELARYAVIRDRVDVLKVLADHGLDWDVTVCICALMKGRLECLRYSNWEVFSSPNTYRYAVRGRNVDCLKFLRDINCPWDAKTTKKAVEIGELECLKYAIRNHCPTDENIGEMAMVSGNKEIIGYLIEQGLSQ
eukprot:TRINITY_DN12086_c0_g1_i1.p1 TRINITY_DN12086_c0_g1~~TRINITY_DN12086_c0_g1_i1.p1  ORF type:complete len:316 (+),score=42.01 TRINITY_DN12086_c0_g1_i1:243-1190(+)